jgi:Uma2 family endonuclease
MSVSTATDELVKVIAHMRPGAVYYEEGVPWEEYEELLDALGEKYSVRIYYAQGRMEIMAPSRMHEAPTGVITRLMGVLSDELEIGIEPLGMTTLKSEMKEQGAEPDASFYVQNAPLIVGRDDLDLNTDPLPDLVIESDHTSSSLDKLAIYAALGVPEIWRIVRHRAQIYLLAGEQYNESAVSRAFPLLSAGTINTFLEQGCRQGASAAARAFREWLRAQPQSAS